MDTVLIVIAGVLMLAGIAGCIVPAMPGPPLSFLGLIVMEFTSAHPYSAGLLVFYALLTIGVTVADYILPMLGAKRFGSSKYGVWGAIIGLIVGPFIIPIIGVLIGPFIGAVLGEIMGDKKKFEDAMRAGLGSFLGLLSGMIIKLVLSLFMLYHYVVGVIDNF
jgi:uncharacterized protein YqgC (DUF456 family)